MPSSALPLLFLLLLPHAVDAARSLSARRVRTPPPTAADRYDRSVTTFSPAGRLLQLEYALVAAEARGSLTVAVECDGVVVVGFPSAGEEYGESEGELDAQGLPSESAPASDPFLVTDDEMEGGADNIDASHNVNVTRIAHPHPSHHAKLHRLSPTHLLLTSGLVGDAHTLASAFRRVASSHTHMTYGEVPSTRELAREMGKVRHGIGLRPGARVLGVVGMLIGLDDADDRTNGSEGADEASNELGVEVRMYRSLPGGTMDRCAACCTGGGADAAGGAARKKALETLLRVTSSQDNHAEEDNAASGEERDAQREERLQRVIEEVGRVVLKHHPEAKSDEESSDEENQPGKAKKRRAVDIWVVRAVPRDKSEQQTPNKAVSPHRFLGKAMMETRYARSVALDQLSTAAQCLIRRTDSNTT